MKLISITAVICMLVFSAGCTTRPYYEGLRMQQETECRNMQGADREEYERRSGMSYDEYQRQLKNHRQRHSEMIHSVRVILL